MAKKRKTTPEIPQEPINGIINHDVETVLTYDARLMSDSEADKMCDLVKQGYFEYRGLTETQLKEYVAKKNALKIATLVDEPLVIKDDVLCIKDDETYTKVKDKKLLQEIYKILLKDRYIRQAVFELPTTYGYKVKSLSDFDIFPRLSRDRYIYSLLPFDHPTHPFYSFTKGIYLESLFKSVNLDDKVTILKGVASYLTKERNALRKIMAENYKRVTINGQRYLEFDIYEDSIVSYFKKKNDFSFACINETCTKLVNKINALEESIIELVEKDD